MKRLRGVLLRSSAAFAALDDASLTAYAVGALGEYLSETWLARLSASCRVPAAEPGGERAPSMGDGEVPSLCLLFPRG